MSAWDATPPTAEELKAPAASWDATPPTKEEIGAGPSPNLDDLPENAVENAGRLLNPLGIAKGVGESVKEGAYQIPKDLTESLAQKVGDVVTGKDSGQTPAGKRVQDIADSETVQHPVDWAIKNPIDAVMLATAPIAPFMEPAAAMDGAVSGTAERAKRFAQQQAVKTMEGTRGQVMQIGPEEARELGQLALDKGVVSPAKGELGMERRLTELERESGAKIGAARSAGDATGSAPDISLLANNAEAKLAPEYSGGMKVGEGGTLRNALDEVRRIKDPSFTGIADKATEMNRYAKGMHQMNQPSGALTDVANFISHENNAALEKALTPKQFAEYKTALKDYGGIQKLQEFFLRKEAREMAGRSGGNFSGVVRGIKDAIGHKTAAVIVNKVAKLLTHPAVAKRLPALLSSAAQGGPAGLATTDHLLRANDPDYAAATNP